ncbi:hypothetical protein PG984_007754 [Apiospora sp. TS-2023a]
MATRLGSSRLPLAEEGGDGVKHPSPDILASPSVQDKIAKLEAIIEKRDDEYKAVTRREFELEAVKDYFNKHGKLCPEDFTKEMDELEKQSEPMESELTALRAEHNDLKLAYFDHPENPNNI